MLIIKECDENALEGLIDEWSAAPGIKIQRQKPHLQKNKRRQGTVSCVGESAPVYPCPRLTVWISPGVVENYPRLSVQIPISLIPIIIMESAQAKR